jgi:hypothetical protein
MAPDYGRTGLLCNTIFRPELITVSALPWLTPGQSFLFGPCSSLPTIYSAEFVSGHLRGVHAMTNLLEQAINLNDGDAAAKLIQEALGIQRNDVVNYFFPKTWPSDSACLLRHGRGR